MRNRPLNLSLLLSTAFVALLMTSCQKGDTGPAGPAGPQGSAGAVGPAGTNGTIIYSGTTTPDPTLGNTGDYYMDLTTGALYGPKTTGGWGSGFSMKGDSGAAGSQIYAGTGAPNASLGTTGDYYVDTVAHTLYGPKVTAGWGLPIELQGPAGPTGTANVQYTPWFGFNGWFQMTSPGIITIYNTENVPAITSNVFNNGTVLVFGQLIGYATQVFPAKSIAQLPIFVSYENQSTLFEQTTDEWQAFSSQSTISIQIFDSGNWYDNNSFPYQGTFRAVIIPGGVSVPANISYKDLQSYLHVTFPD